jgi:RhtB (resistance to homoserine/threonine) family protein
MDLFLNWTMIAMIALAGAMSPGPDFVITVRNSILHDRRAGVMTAFGIAAGLCLHMTYCLLGIATLIAQSVTLFTTLKWVGAAYLLVIGIKCLISKGYSDASMNELPIKNSLNAGAKSAFISGFLTNLLNPKATLFFLALFTQVIDPHTPFKIQILYAATVVIIGFLWWLCVAIALTDHRIKSLFLGFSKWIDRACGGLMIMMGLKLAFTKIS